MLRTKSQRLDAWELVTIERALKLYASHVSIDNSEFFTNCLDQLRSKLDACDGIRLVQKVSTPVAGSPRLERMAIKADAARGSMMDDIL